VAVSTGSACSAGHDGSSVVLAALSASVDEMRRVIRVSGGWDSSAEEWLALAEAFVQVGREMMG
jgi:cysteine desulfurase